MGNLIAKELGVKAEIIASRPFLDRETSTRGDEFAATRLYFWRHGSLCDLAGRSVDLKERSSVGGLLITLNKRLGHDKIAAT